MGLISTIGTLPQSHQKKPLLLTVTYRDEINRVLQTDINWISGNRSITIPLKNQNSYKSADVSLMAYGNKYNLRHKIVVANVQEDTVRSVTPKPDGEDKVHPNLVQPCDHCPGNPGVGPGNTLETVYVYGQANGYSYATWYDLLTNFSGASSIQYNDPYSGSYSNSGGGTGNYSAGSRSTNNSGNFSQEDKCGGLAKMAALSTQSGTGDNSKEVVAVLTKDGQIVIFPMGGNTANNASLRGSFDEVPTYDPTTQQQNGTQVVF